MMIVHGIYVVYNDVTVRWPRTAHPDASSLPCALLTCSSLEETSYRPYTFERSTQYSDRSDCCVHDRRRAYAYAYHKNDDSCNIVNDFETRSK